MTLSSEPPRTAAPPADRQAGSRCEIQLQNPCRYPESGARRVRPWIEPVVGDLTPRAGSLAVRFVSDREMRRLNATYRRRDEPTDVLSFPGDLDAGSNLGAMFHLDEILPLGEVLHLGDVVVSVPTARRQARRLGHSVERELRVLVLHGVLHCLGHDHETDGGEMEELEQRLRWRYIDHE